MQVWKFPLPLQGMFGHMLPRDAQLLSCQIQGGQPMLWALVDPLASPAPRRFIVLGTGHEAPSLLNSERLVFIDTFQMSGGALVFHLFEIGTTLL